VWHVAPPHHRAEWAGRSKRAEGSARQAPSGKSSATGRFHQLPVVENPARFRALIGGQDAQRHVSRRSPDGVDARNRGDRLAGHPIELDDLEPAAIRANAPGERGQALDLHTGERELVAMDEQPLDNPLGAVPKWPRGGR
jgi:hypothetical protein